MQYCLSIQFSNFYLQLNLEHWEKMIHDLLRAFLGETDIMLLFFNNPKPLILQLWFQAIAKHLSLFMF